MSEQMKIILFINWNTAKLKFESQTIQKAPENKRCNNIYLFLFIF